MVNIMATKSSKPSRTASSKLTENPIATSEKLLRDIRRQTKRIFTSEQKTLIVMEGIRGELSVAELCRKHGISAPTYYA